MEEAVRTLLATGNEALIAFTRRDILGEDVNIERLWTLPEVEKILRRQQPDGSWLYPNRKAALRSPTNYNQYQTWMTLAQLVDFYGFSRKHEAIRNASEYLFSFQTGEGEFRGIYGSQYSPNYSAAITEFLIKAGYTDDERIGKSLDWLLALRQDDGGWAIPFRTRNRGLEAIREVETIEPDRTRPFSHLVTGIVLRPFSLLPERRASVQYAGLLLADRIFSRDTYPDRQGAEYWVRFTYPYHWTDLLSTLDTLTLLGIASHPKITAIREWFSQRQREDGTYEVRVMTGARYRDVGYWITMKYLQVARRL